MSTPTGRIMEQDGQHVLVQTREFRAPIEDVWAAVTEPGRLARWIGTWEGDPDGGRVQFRMLFEGEEHAGEDDGPSGSASRRTACTSPLRLGEEVWLLESRPHPRRRGHHADVLRSPA